MRSPSIQLKSWRQDLKPSIGYAEPATMMPMRFMVQLSSRHSATIAAVSRHRHGSVWPFVSIFGGQLYFRARWLIGICRRVVPINANDRTDVGSLTFSFELPPTSPGMTLAAAQPSDMRK